MIKLPWKKELEIDEQLLKFIDIIKEDMYCSYISIMAEYSGNNDTFTLQLPWPIFWHIKKDGINAKFNMLPDDPEPGMVWVRVEKEG